MTDKRKNLPRCSYCNQYVGYDFCDSGTRYGCSDPEEPEPYDPDLFCRPCGRKNYKETKEKAIKNGEGPWDCYWWIKPIWYLKAIKDAGFILVKNNYYHYRLEKIK